MYSDCWPYRKERHDINLSSNNLDNIYSELKSRGWIEEKRLEIPNGPCCIFRDPAGNRIAIYENKRPNVMEEFKGRIDENDINTHYEKIKYNWSSALFIESLKSLLIKFSLVIQNLSKMSINKAAFIL